MWQLRYQHTQAIRAAREALSASSASSRIAGGSGSCPPTTTTTGPSTSHYPRRTLLAGRRLALGRDSMRSFAACCLIPSRARDAAVLAPPVRDRPAPDETVAADVGDYQPGRRP